METLALTSVPPADEIAALLAEGTMAAIDTEGRFHMGFPAAIARLTHAQFLESLEEYVLVDTDSSTVECYRRAPNNRWILQEFRGQSELELASVGLRLALPDVFENIGQ